MVVSKPTRGTGKSPSAQLAEYMAPYSPEIARRARAVLAKLRKRLPGARELVYDNYNALVIGFSPTERAGDAIFSLVLYPRWVTLFFLKGAMLPDPEGLLRGSGRRVRHVVLEDAKMLDRPALQALMVEALKGTHSALELPRPRRTLFKARAPKRRPRRPAA